MVFPDDFDLFQWAVKNERGFIFDAVDDVADWLEFCSHQLRKSGSISENEALLINGLAVAARGDND